MLKLFSFFIGLFWVTATALSAGNPVVNAPVFEQKVLDLGDETTVSVVASSPAGGELKYLWSAIAGTIAGNGPSVRYIAPGRYPVANLDTVTVTVRDELSASATKSEVIRVEKRNAPAKLFISPAGKTLLQGQTGTFRVNLDTRGETGKKITLALKYDSNKIEIVDAEPEQAGTQVKNGNLFPRVSHNSARSGSISFAAGGSGISGTGTVAEIIVRGKKPGETKMDFDFVKYSLQGTSLIQNAEEPLNLLGEVSGAELTVEPAANAEEIVLPETPRLTPVSDLPEKTSESGGWPLGLILLGGAGAAMVWKRF